MSFSVITVKENERNKTTWRFVNSRNFLSPQQVNLLTFEPALSFIWLEILVGIRNQMSVIKLDYVRRLRLAWDKACDCALCQKLSKLRKRSCPLRRPRRDKPFSRPDFLHLIISVFRRINYSPNRFHATHGFISDETNIRSLFVLRFSLRLTRSVLNKAKSRKTECKRRQRRTNNNLISFVRKTT